MEEDLKDQNVTNDSKREEAEKSKEGLSASISRRQILYMGWSLPVAMGLTAIIPKMADAGATVTWSDKHADVHHDSHADHYDDASQARTTKINPQFKQSLSQDVLKIRQEINTLQTKLNMAQEGQDLGKIGAKGSALNLRNSFQALSAKIKDAEAELSKIRNIQNLSNGARQGINILNNLEQTIGANRKSVALEQLNQLNKSLGGLEAEINRL
jgi:hypothetical protein